MRYLTCFILAFLCLSQAMAQNEEESEAFYIYRNDGEFNGFFYDEVEDMRCSKLDLDSIEHDIYVVQEVVTADSIYRIPLCAIDSIGFVQPEVILNPGIHDIDEMGLMPYVIDTDCDTYVYARKSTPYDLLPKVGDVLMRLGDKEQDIRGFGRKVTKIYDDGNNRYVIKLSPLENLSDVFTQLIGVEKLVTDNEGKVRRKVSQMRKASGSGTANLINLAFTVQKDLPYNDKSKITLAAELGMKLSVGVEYNITYSNFFFKVTDHSTLTAKPSITATCEGASFERNWSLLPGLCFYVPASCPVMSIDPLPKLFIKGSLSASIGMTFPKSGIGMTETFIFDNGSISYNREYNIEGYNAFDSDRFVNFFKQMDFNANLHGELQAGIKSEIGIGAADWLSDIVDTYIGVDVYVGPKIEGDIEFSMQKLYEGGTHILQSSPKVTLTGLSVDAEAKGTFKFLWNDPNTETFATLSKQFWKEEYYALPYMERFEFKQNLITGNHKMTAKLAHKSYLPVKLGIEFEEFTTHETTVSYMPDESDKTGKDGDLEMTVNLPKGNYYILPIYDLNGLILKEEYRLSGFTVKELLTDLKYFYLWAGEDADGNGNTFARITGPVTVTPISDCQAKIEGTPFEDSGCQGYFSMTITIPEEKSDTAIIDDIQWHYTQSRSYEGLDYSTTYGGHVPQITGSVKPGHSYGFYCNSYDASCSCSYKGWIFSHYDEEGKQVFIPDAGSYSNDDKYPITVSWGLSNTRE